MSKRKGIYFLNEIFALHQVLVFFRILFNYSSADDIGVNFGVFDLKMCLLNQSRDLFQLVESILLVMHHDSVIDLS